MGLGTSIRGASVGRTRQYGTTSTLCWCLGALTAYRSAQLCGGGADHPNIRVPFQGIWHRSTGSTSIRMGPRTDFARHRQQYPETLCDGRSKVEERGVLSRSPLDDNLAWEINIDCVSRIEAYPATERNFVLPSYCTQSDRSSESP